MDSTTASGRKESPSWGNRGCPCLGAPPSTGLSGALRPQGLRPPGVGVGWDSEHRVAGCLGEGAAQETLRSKHRAAGGKTARSWQRHRLQSFPRPQVWKRSRFLSAARALRDLPFDDWCRLWRSSRCRAASPDWRGDLAPPAAPGSPPGESAYVCGGADAAA